MSEGEKQHDAGSCDAPGDTGGRLAAGRRKCRSALFHDEPLVYGRQIGRTFGIPTVNMRVQRDKAALSGVFAVTVDGLGGTRLGAANIGVRPTVAVDGRPSKEPLLEVHIFDFDEEVYGRLLTVTLKWKIRDERWFPSLQDMKVEIDRDVAKTRAYFAEHPPAPGSAL